MSIFFLNIYGKHSTKIVASFSSQSAALAFAQANDYCDYESIEEWEADHAEPKCAWYQNNGIWAQAIDNYSYVKKSTFPNV